MKVFAVWLYNTDKQLFASLRTALASRFLETNAAMLGNLYAWMPFFVFLAIMIYLGKPQTAVYSIFFALGTFILSFQAASLLSNYLMQPAPWNSEYWFRGVQLPAFAHGSEISLPDWPIASMVGTFHFVRLRLKAWQETNIILLWLPVLMYCLLRVYAGYTYPLGVVFGILVGVLIGWLMFQLARNVELLAPAVAAPEDDDPAE